MQRLGLERYWRVREWRRRAYLQMLSPQLKFLQMWPICSTLETLNSAGEALSYWCVAIFKCETTDAVEMLCSFLVAMGDISLRKTGVEEKRAKAQKDSNVLLDYTRKAIQRLTYLKK